ncbi:MAG: MATE family efflux transporter [Ruminiclostridium sp.]|nr:MATE family efflux transporter [Ruminiclostridium sp.]
MGILQKLLSRNKPLKPPIDMVNGPILSGIIRFSIPLMLTGVLQLLFNACDMVVVGQFAGSDPLAAVGSTMALTNLMLNAFLGLSVGVNVLAAHALGSGDREWLEKIVHTAVTLSLLCGLILALVGVSLCRTCLVAMDTPPEVLDLAVLYMRIYFCGMPVVMLYNFGAALLRAQGNTKQPLIYLSISGIVNVVLNLVLVIVFHLSVAGVAIATIVSQALSAALILRYLIRQEGPCGLDFRKLRLDLTVVKKTFQIGIPASFNGIMFSFSNIQIQSAINSFGPSAMAGSAAAANLEGFIYLAANSLHQAAVNFVGQNVGAGNNARLPKVTVACCSVSALVSLLLGSAVYLFGGTLLGLYTQAASDIVFGMTRLKIIALTYFLCGIMDTMVGVLRGMGYAMVPTAISVVGVCGFRILWLVTVFAWYPTVEVLFLSYPSSWILTTLAQLISYGYIRRKNFPIQKSTTI